jgi:ditrans,polycis-polyprenyl diphosphate synthase
MTQAAIQVQSKLKKEQSIEDATMDLKSIEQELDGCMQTAGCFPVDILLRTSGEKRLSDFLMWQVCETTQLAFVEPPWPEFTFWTFLPIMLDFQLEQIRRKVLNFSR